MESQSFERTEAFKTPDFKWDVAIQSHLLSAYGMGYIFGNLTGGLFCSLLGGTNFMAIGMFLSGIFQLVSPASAETSPWLLYLLRFLVGACVSKPTCLMRAFMSKWEGRSIFSAIRSGWSCSSGKCPIDKVVSHSGEGQS